MTPEEDESTPDAPEADAPAPEETGGGEPTAEPAGEETAEQPETGGSEPTADPDPDESPASEQAPEEPPAEQPQASTEPSTDAADEAPAEPSTDADAPSEEPVADAAPADDAAEAPDEPTAEDAPKAPEKTPESDSKRPAPAGAPERKRDTVPGADLEPIAIGEERELSAEERARAEADEEERAASEARAAAADDDAEEIVARQVTVPADARIQATGKRKSAVARVIVRAGDGSFHVNDRTLEEYFVSTQHQSLARQPLVTSGYDGNVDVRVRVHGGGVSGQAGAVRHGVARALTSLEPELRGDLKRRGMLTRDDRRKERKKAGLKKARKRPQFSKR